MKYLTRWHVAIIAGVITVIIDINEIEDPLPPTGLYFLPTIQEKAGKL